MEPNPDASWRKKLTLSERQKVAELEERMADLKRVHRDLRAAHTTIMNRAAKRLERTPP